MTPLPDYQVNFSNGNLNPSPAHPWGSMVQGESSANDHAESVPDSNGFTLGVYRSSGASSRYAKIPPAVSNSVYVLPGSGTLPLESVLRIHAEFDLPNASHLYSPLAGGGTVPAPPPPGGLPVHPEPWAVALNVKFGNQNDVDGEPKMGITCQFNLNQNADDVGGVRLNTPKSDQGDAGVNIDHPLNYRKYRGVSWPFGWRAWPTRFSLDYVFSGIGAVAGGSATGSATLNVGNRNDMKLFTNRQLSGKQNWIDAIGIALVTADGVGQISIRLRSFSVSVLS